MNFGKLPDDSRSAPDHYAEGNWGGLPLASLSDRYLAALIDYGWIPVLAFFEALPTSGWTLILLVWLNSAVAQGWTGKSLGKAIMGITLGMAVADRSGSPVLVELGVKIASKRLFWHYKDLFTLGTLPTRSMDRQTYADEEASTFVFAGTPKLAQRPRNWTGYRPR